MASQQCNVTFEQYLLPATIIGIAFAAIILLIVVCIKNICCRKVKWLQGNLASTGDKWKRIEYFSKKEDTRPLAIIYACSLLDHTMKTKGYLGETMGERLDSARTAIGNNQIWKILRLRNELAHDADMKSLDKEKTQYNLKIIRQALFDLDVTV